MGLLKGIKKRTEAGSSAVPDRTTGPARMRGMPLWGPWRRVRTALPGDGGPVSVPPHRSALAAIKGVHTLAWFSIESCMAYVLYSGFAGRSDRDATIAGGVVAGETLVFAANRFRCPLTQLAGRLGAADAGVTDIWLPKWFAHNLPAIHAPLLVLAVYLHARNLGPARRNGHASRRRRWQLDSRSVLAHH